MSEEAKLQGEPWPTVVSEGNAERWMGLCQKLPEVWRLPLAKFRTIRASQIMSVTNGNTLNTIDGEEKRERERKGKEREDFLYLRRNGDIIITRKITSLQSPMK